MKQDIINFMSIFSENDRLQLEKLVYDETLEPSFDSIKSCLVWSDERPADLSSDGYEKLCDLWIVRSFIHQNLPQTNWGLDPDYFKSVWDAALEENIKWPGFKRLTLSEKDNKYLKQMLKEEDNNAI